ncbi:MAG: glycosyltransferase family 4 protein [Spirochaetia bacterium]|nr:glycosyltransferase family 4 protein [Spirochaetia bacterium]
MNILVLSPVLPYGPSDGDRLRIYRTAEQLKAAGHKLHLVSFINPGEEPLIKETLKIFDTVDTARISRATVLYNAALCVPRVIPVNTGAYELKKMHRLVAGGVKRYAPDMAYAYRLRMAQYAEGLDMPKAIDLVDSMAGYMDRALNYEKNPVRLLYYLYDRPLVLAAEKSAIAGFDAVFLNSEDDRDFLGDDRAIVAPNGANGAKVGRSKNMTYTVGFFGNLNYRPNLDAMGWFLKNVWKKSFDSDKNIRLEIAGSGGEKLAHKISANCEIKGFVRDIDALVASWDVTVVPVRYGAGRQNKIMQAWADRTPVIATSFTARGVYGEDGKNLLTADTAQEFTRAINRLRFNRKLSARIAAGGAATQKKYFDWKRTGGIILAAITGKKRDR